MTHEPSEGGSRLLELKIFFFSNRNSEPLEVCSYDFIRYVNSYDIIRYVIQGRLVK